MSHIGVTCDMCLKSGFRGRRYKCLLCYDYDLCEQCFDKGRTSNQHLASHPVQCILTKEDLELFYAGETINFYQQQSFTCPICGQMGFSELELGTHVSAEHHASNLEVICPICAGSIDGEQNFMTDDFIGHLALEHQGSGLMAYIESRNGGDASCNGASEASTAAVASAVSTRATNSSSATTTANRRPSRHAAAARRPALQPPALQPPALNPSTNDGIDPLEEIFAQLSTIRGGGFEFPIERCGRSVGNRGAPTMADLFTASTSRMSMASSMSGNADVLGFEGRSLAPNLFNTKPFLGDVNEVGQPKRNPPSPRDSDEASKFLLPQLLKQENSKQQQQQLSKEARANRSEFIQTLVCSMLAMSELPTASEPKQAQPTDTDDPMQGNGNAADKKADDPMQGNRNAADKNADKKADKKADENADENADKNADKNADNTADINADNTAENPVQETKKPNQDN